MQVPRRTYWNLGFLQLLFCGSGSDCLLSCVLAMQQCTLCIYNFFYMHGLNKVCLFVRVE